MTVATAEAGVRAVLDRLTQAWNDGDAAYVTFFGLNFPGRAQIESSHRALFEGPLKGSKLAGRLGEAAKVRFVRPDVAIVIVGGGSSADRTAFQNTRVSDPRS